MTTKISNLFTINGTIDTNQSVMENMQQIANACGSWVTYDTTQGKWAVVINQAGSSVKSFNDSNIIGSINIRGTGIYELYNRCDINFPNKDILDQTDGITVSIPEGDLFQNEILNTLNFSNDLVNNPVQAEALASRELKQSRIDKIIEFRTDFTSIGLTAGDLISVTNSAYGYTNKIFRILSISEEDVDGGSIVLSITAFEYDSDVYSTAGLTRTASSTRNDIGSVCKNTTVQGSIAQAALPSNLASALGIVTLLNQATGAWEYFKGKATSLPNADTAVITWTFMSPGTDLDIRARLISPNLGQNSVDDYLGYTGAGTGYFDYFWQFSTSSWGSTAGGQQGVPNYADDLIFWGGDNQGTGQEQIAIDIQRIRALYPSLTYLIVECRGNWYVNATDRPVKLTADLYRSVSLVPTPPTFTAASYEATQTVVGLERAVYSNLGADGGDPGGTTLGDLIGYFVYEFATGQAIIVDDLSSLGFS